MVPPTWTLPRSRWLHRPILIDPASSARCFDVAVVAGSVARADERRRPDSHRRGGVESKGLRFRRCIPGVIMEDGGTVSILPPTILGFVFPDGALAHCDCDRRPPPTRDPTDMTARPSDSVRPSATNPAVVPTRPTDLASGPARPTDRSPRRRPLARDRFAPVPRADPGKGPIRCSTPPGVATESRAPGDPTSPERGGPSTSSLSSAKPPRVKPRGSDLFPPQQMSSGWPSAFAG